MKIRYENRNIERTLIAINALAAAAVTATYVLLYGFKEPLLSVSLLHTIQVGALLVFLGEKVIRFFNALSRADFVKANWFEIPLLIVLCLVAVKTAGHSKMLAVGVYLVVQVVVKVCRSCVDLAASGRNPAKALIASFIVLIIVGAGLLMLPRSCNCDDMSFVDAMFTATSATCVTGLIIRDTGQDYSFMGQVVILGLIQLGGLGIVIFGAVIALLLGQALSFRESVAMQDLLNEQTLGRIGTMIGFIFVATIVIEAAGAISMFKMYSTSGLIQQTHQQWFYSIFHSISAFCNAGFSLFNNSFVDYSSHWTTYGVIAPLIILGGLGFGVLYNIFDVVWDRIKRFLRNSFSFGPAGIFKLTAPKRFRLQTKIVLATSLVLIISGAAAIMLFEHNSTNQGIGAALFQSITARTAGFNTIDISSMSAAGKFVLMVLMFIGGSPGSTAGGIKTVTLTIVIMVAYATLRKRRQVELFKRSVREVIVGRAITVTLLFAAVFLIASLSLSITEKENAFAMGDLMFETTSALGTVGLSTGITSSLTTAGKWIIIITMLIGRLGPLTLLASMTFNLKPAGYDYPAEPIVVG